MTLVDTTTGEVVETLSADEANQLTAKIKSYVGTAWSMLKEAHDRRAWVALGYGSWAEYVRVEFDMSRSRAYQLIEQARIVYELEEAGLSTIVDANEGQTRALAAADPEDRAEVWQRAQDEAAAENRKPTAADIKRLADEKRRKAEQLSRTAETCDRKADELDAEADLIEQAADPVAEYLANDPDIEHAKWRKKVVDLVARSRDMLTLDPVEVAETVEPEWLERLEWIPRDIEAWVTKLRAAQRSGLRVVDGGKS